MNVSVFITSYNQKEFLKDAIESVLGQTLRPYEIIIVDDHSSDGSQELISSFKASYPDLIVPVFHEQNRGVAQVRISALEIVNGDHVTYVDGDDLYLPRKLEVESKLITKGDFQIAFSNNMYFRGGADNIEHIWAYNKDAMPAPGNMYFETLSRAFPRSSLFRMELVNYYAWKQIGFHDTDLKIYEDFDMRIRLTKKLNVNYTLEPFTMIRLGDTGLSHSSNQVHAHCLEYILKKHLTEIENLSEEKSTAVKKMFASMISSKLNNESKSSKSKAENPIEKIIAKTKNWFKK